MGRRWGSPSPEERFWEKVDKDGPLHPVLGTKCWDWMAYADPNGRPKFSWGGKSGFAYRFGYELENGPVPDGLRLDHQCHRPICVRPSHLLAVTAKQNSDNRKGANRNNAVGIRGVFPNGKGKFIAQRRHLGKLYHIGTFANPQEAAEALANWQPLC